MISKEKIEANRLNARLSTGPKSREGRLRSAQNARRHGLSVSIFYDEEWSKEIEILSRKLVSQNTDPEFRAHANRFAEAQADLSRIRATKHQILEQLLSQNVAIISQLPSRSSEFDPQALKDLTKIDRYEKRAISRRRSAMRELARAGGLNG